MKYPPPDEKHRILGKAPINGASFGSFSILIRQDFIGMFLVRMLLASIVDMYLHHRRQNVRSRTRQ